MHTRHAAVHGAWMTGEEPQSSAAALYGNRVTLRGAKPTDVDDKLALGVDAEIVRMYGAASGVEPRSRAQLESWYQRLLDTPHAWVIEVNGRAVGEARLHSVHEADRRGSLAIGIDDPTLLGRGYGTEALNLLLGYAFDTMRLHRLGVRVIEYNARALRAYEKCGFVVEGREREAARIDNRWYDDVMLSLLAREWRERKAGGVADVLTNDEAAE